MIPYATQAAGCLSAVLSQTADEIAAQLVRPPKPEMGDVGFPCFALSKALKKAPPQIATELASQLTAAEPFAEIRAVGPYVNFFLSQAALVDASVKAVMANPAAWGKNNAGAGKTIVIDYSSPNIAKPLGVHHIRSTMIGSALARLYAACGWKVVTVNHLGDWGTNFGQLMVSYKRAESDNPNVPVDIDALLKLYVKFHADAEEDDSLEGEARAWFKKLEDGDAEAVRLWKIFVEESLKGLKQLYARLGVTFDVYAGESFFNDKMEATVARLSGKNLLMQSDGAMVVDLEAEGMPPCLIRKRDGATTYATRDLSAAEYRHATFGFDKCLYVVANQQELHFRQVFKVLDKMGYGWAGGCEHIKFGMLSFGKGVFGEGQTTGSTRKGHVVFLEDVIDRAVEAAKAIIVENAREEEVTKNADALAEQVGVGAVIFSEYLQRRQKDVVFTWEKALNLQGDSGPYLQYTHARLSSVLRKYGKTLPAQIPWNRLTSALEKGVLMALAEFPAAVERATAENEAAVIADYLLELCGVFNRMFTDKDNHRIVSDDEELTAARVGLVEAVRVTLRNGLALLGLGAPERM